MMVARPRGLIVLSVSLVLINPPASQGQRAQLAPAGNYHAHLTSEASARLLLARPLPSVELPADLDRVVRNYERFTKSGNPDSLTALFAEDGFFPSVVRVDSRAGGYRTSSGRLEPRRYPRSSPLFCVE